MLTHDPGMYPKRLILDDARQFGIAVLGLDVNASRRGLLRWSGVGPATTSHRRPSWTRRPGPRRRPRGRGRRTCGLPDGRGYGIRIGLDDVKGINAEAEVARIVAGQSLRLAVGLLAPRLGVPAGGGAAGGRGCLRLACTGIGSTVAGAAAAGRVTRRDLLLQVTRARPVEPLDRSPRSARCPAGGTRPPPAGVPGRRDELDRPLADDVRGTSRRRQSRATGPVRPVDVRLPVDVDLDAHLRSLGRRPPRHPT